MARVELNKSGPYNLVNGELVSKVRRGDLSNFRSKVLSLSSNLEDKTSSTSTWFSSPWWDTRFRVMKYINQTDKEFRISSVNFTACACHSGNKEFLSTGGSIIANGQGCTVRVFILTNNDKDSNVGVGACTVNSITKSNCSTYKTYNSETGEYEYKYDTVSTTVSSGLYGTQFGIPATKVYKSDGNSVSFENDGYVEASTLDSTSDDSRSGIEISNCPLIRKGDEVTVLVNAQFSDSNGVLKMIWHTADIYDNPPFTVVVKDEPPINWIWRFNSDNKWKLDLPLYRFDGTKWVVIKKG